MKRALAFFLFVGVFASPRLAGPVILPDLLLPILGFIAVLKWRSYYEIFGKWACRTHLLFLVYLVVVAFPVYFILQIPLWIFLAFFFRLIGLLVIGAFVAHLTVHHEKFVRNSLFASMALVLSYGLYQIGSGSLAGYYGIGLPYEVGPSQAGLLFALSTSFFFSQYLITGSRLLQFATILFGIGTVATISRTAILGIGGLFAISPLLVWLGGRTTRANLFSAAKLLLIVSGVATLVGGLFFWQEIYSFVTNAAGLATEIIARLSRIETGASVRVERWIRFLDSQITHSPLSLFLGLGFGSHAHLYQPGTFVLAFDSQYLRSLYELGIIGTLLWFSGLASLVHRCWTNNFRYGAMLVLALVPALISGVTHEIFLVSKPSMLIYIIIGHFVGISHRHKLNSPKEFLSTAGDHSYGSAQNSKNLIAPRLPES